MLFGAVEVEDVEDASPDTGLLAKEDAAVGLACEAVTVKVIEPLEVDWRWLIRTEGACREGRDSQKVSRATPDSRAQQSPNSAANGRSDQQHDHDSEDDVEDVPMEATDSVLLVRTWH